MPDKLNIAVLGAGSWGTTLAILLDENGHRVALWEFFPELAEAIRRDGENKRLLPGVRVPGSISIHSDITKALEEVQLVVFAVPSHVVRSAAKMVAESGCLTEGTIIVNAAKGLEEKTLKRMSEVLADELPVAAGNIGTLVGPSHAEEVSRKMPTSVVIAATDAATASRVQDVFFRPYFRIYTNDDLIGVEVGVALKNIIAIAAGVCDGLGYGDNTKAALLTRGLVEITRLGCALGAKRETFFGLAGIGDLIATALSRHSRNRHVGEKIGRGESLDRVLRNMVMVAEGVRTTRAAVDMGKKLDADLPIISSVHAVLFEKMDPRKAINQLMSRPPQEEMNWMRAKGLERG
ncbi:MAG: NAD(P)H-dependent glycerol-3-phosphate dehydrogenase [Candidatus Krumholzibacteria bacterium]|nr:NAD(P)H-dependent glycerol-3-phosphate dehydrogenase [Candidatus Krumholzibacteria bacterium]